MFRRRAVSLTFRAAQFVDPLDMFPANPVCAHWICRRRGHSALRRQQRGHNVIGIRRLRKVVRRSNLDRCHCSRNRPVAGQDDDAAVIPAFANALDHVQAVAVFKPQVDNRVCRRPRGRGRRPSSDRVGCFDVKAPFFHCPSQASQERLVVVHDQERWVWSNLFRHLFNRFGSGKAIRWPARRQIFRTRQGMPRSPQSPPPYPRGENTSRTRSRGTSGR